MIEPPSGADKSGQGMRSLLPFKTAYFFLGIFALTVVPSF
jgi:hypothetical protein